MKGYAIWKKENDFLKKKAFDLETKTDNIEAQSRRNNLIFHGIPEKNGETWVESEKAVRVEATTLHLDSADSFNTERAHGLHSQSTNRPIMMRVSFYKDKSEVLDVAIKELKLNNDFREADDFTQSSMGQSKLFPVMKQARDGC